MSLRLAFLGSILIHVLILIFCHMGLKPPSFKKVEPTISIDVVNIAEKSAAPQQSPEPKVERKNEKPEAEELQEVKKEENQATDVKKPEITPPQVEEKKVEEEKELPKPKPEKPIEPIVKPELEKIPEKIVKKKTIPPKVKEVPKKKVVPKSSEKAQLDLRKKKKGNKKAKSSKSLDDFLKKGHDEEGGDQTSLPNAGETVTASEIDAIRQHIRKCWRVPAGIQGAKDISVDVDLDVALDGRVTRAEVTDKARLNNDAMYESAARSAIAAVMDPECNRLPIPKGKYDEFKKITMSFSPKDMF